VQNFAVGERVIGAQNYPDRVGAQDVSGDAGFVERRAGECDVDEAGAKPGGRVGQVGFADAGVHAGLGRSR